eukprot:4093022-Amphidinium_carterae.1
MEASKLSALRVITPEILGALGTAHANSSKIHSTLRHQTPTFYEEIMEVINQIKGVGESEPTVATSSNTQKTDVHVSLGSDDDMIIKIIKKQKVNESTDSIAGTSATAAGSV